MTTLDLGFSTLLGSSNGQDSRDGNSSVFRRGSVVSGLDPGETVPGEEKRGRCARKEPRLFGRGRDPKTDKEDTEGRCCDCGRMWEVRGESAMRSLSGDRCRGRPGREEGGETSTVLGIDRVTPTIGSQGVWTEGNPGVCCTICCTRLRWLSPVVQCQPFYTGDGWEGSPKSRFRYLRGAGDVVSSRARHLVRVGDGPHTTTRRALSTPPPTAPVTEWSPLAS